MKRLRSFRIQATLRFVQARIAHGIRLHRGLLCQIRTAGNIAVACLFSCSSGGRQSLRSIESMAAKSGKCAIAGLFFALLSTMSATAAPSFDCHSNLNPAERAICANPELGELDTRVSELYFEYLNNHAGVGSGFRSQQHNWILTRDRCGDDVGCLRQAYASRRDEIQSLLDEHYQGSMPDSGPLPTRNFAWNFQNSTGRTLDVQLYSKGRGVVWPSADRHWIIPPDGSHYTDYIACQAGEYICYGGWPEDGSTDYWGAGRDGKQGCERCCYYCRGAGTQLINMTP